MEEDVRLVTIRLFNVFEEVHTVLDGRKISNTLCLARIGGPYRWLRQLWWSILSH